MSEKFESPRAAAERERLHRIQVFDFMADLALAGSMGMDEAFATYRATVGIEQPAEGEDV